MGVQGQVPLENFKLIMYPQLAKIASPGIRTNTLGSCRIDIRFYAFITLSLVLEAKGSSGTRKAIAPSFPLATAPGHKGHGKF